MPKLIKAAHRQTKVNNIRELSPYEAQQVSGGEGSCGPGDCGVGGCDGDSAGTLSEVTVSANASSPTDSTTGNPMNLIPSGLGFIAATIGLIGATTPVGVALATLAATGAVMNAVVNNNASLPTITPWGGPEGSAAGGP